MTDINSTSTYDAVDLFAGPGGWDVAGRDLGLHTLGIEWDHAACETRRAAGLPTIEGDVRSYGPTDFPGVKGFIASPPCQTFSMAGGGAGRKALDVVLQLVKALEAREPVDASAFDDERTSLVLEPLRWVLEAKDAGHPYEWAAFEQVPTVLPVWEAMAEVLRREGYSVAVGKLSAEQYGVPQTRKRAILIAKLHGEATLPAPTHRAYKKGTPQDAGDPALLPWVSMAEALGWTAPGLVGFPRRADTPSNGAGDDVVNLGGTDYRARDLRDSEEPAQVLTSKARSWSRYLISNAQANATVRSADEPAPTITAGHDSADRRWQTTNNSTKGGTRAGLVRSTSEPSRTLDQGARQWTWDAEVKEGAHGHNPPRWVHERPATAVQCDPRIGQPGHKCMTDDCHPGRGKTRQFDEGSVRVTPEEAAVLQSFPADHPWQGTRTKVFQQIGNAVPPGLARAVLGTATSVDVPAPEPRPFSVDPSSGDYETGTSRTLHSDGLTSQPAPSSSDSASTGSDGSASSAQEALPFAAWTATE